MFAIGTGRCGTKFLSELLDKEPKVASHHERHPLNDTFHRFCKWYDLPIDHEGFLKIKETAILADLKTHEFSFESSAYLSMSVEELYDHFEAKFILLIRRPEKVVNSYFVKGWYENEIILGDANKIPTQQNVKHFHHFLGRTLPKGDAFQTWNKLTKIGKLAWYWNTLNKRAKNQFRKLPIHAAIQIVKLEELDFEKYKSLTEFIGFQTDMDLTAFNQIAQSKPNAFKEKKRLASWTRREFEEFEGEVKEMANHFQYVLPQYSFLQNKLERLKNFGK